MTDPTLEDRLVQAKGRRQRRVLLALGAVALTGVALGAGLWAVNKVAERSQGAGEDTVTARVDDDACAGEDCGRDVFLDALRDFSGEARPALDAVSLSAWDPALAKAIDAEEDAALSAFDAGDYNAATQAIEEALALGEQALTRAQERYDDNLADAYRAFADDDAEFALDAIERALQVAPQADEARALSQRIAVLPEVLAQLDVARVADVENRPKVQAEALEQVLTLDPQRTEVAARLAALESEDRTQRYARAVASAERALADGRLTQAQRAIEQARRIDPTQDLSFLQTRVDAASADRRLDDALARGRDATLREDWAGAAAAYEQALALEPTNAAAVAGARNAQVVTDGLRRLGNYLGDPLRIGTPRIADAARDLAAELAPERGLSQALDERLSRLERYLADVDRPVRVTLISDGLTDISVRRVGQVGKHERATIELTPGRYELEGRRPGYRSKLVSLDVNFGLEQVEVELVCDEPAA